MAQGGGEVMQERWLEGEEVAQAGQVNGEERWLNGSPGF